MTLTLGQGQGHKYFVVSIGLILQPLLGCLPVWKTVYLYIYHCHRKLSLFKKIYNRTVVGVYVHVQDNVHFIQYKRKCLV
jgi:hypothetical protein